VNGDVCSGICSDVHAYNNIILAIVKMGQTSVAVVTYHEL
jgi:hypothetical protein